jgi:hypothetical protein
MIAASTKVRMALVTLFVAAGIALAPAAAQADQYIVDHCATPDGTPAAAFPGFTGATSVNCGIASGGALRLQVPTSQLGVGGTVNIGLSVPGDRPNIQIERVITEWEAPGSDSQYVFMPIFNHFGQEIFNLNPPARTTVDRALPAGNRSLTWAVYCGGSAVCNFASQYIITIYRTRLYLNESVAPTLTVTGGTLTGTGAKAGQQSLVLDAGDADSGVSSATVALGSTVVGSVKFACQFKDWSVCPRDEKNKLVQVDTTQVPDGSHELLVTVRDAANNALTTSLGAVTIANGPGPGAPNGASASRLAKVTASYATTQKGSRQLRFTSQPTIRGKLVSEQGQPIAGATVAVLQRPRQAGAVPVQIATVATQPDGSFSYKLPGGPSRTITFAYTAFSGDATPATSASLRTVVRALVSARITPRSVRGHKPITLTGRLNLLGREGVEVKVQGRNGRRWQTIGTVKTTRGGKFRWRYRFSRAGAGRTFAFRATVDSPIYPFAAGKSKAIFVRVR